MKVAFFDAHPFEQAHFEPLNKSFHHEIFFIPQRLTSETVHAAKGFDCVCSFANDKVNAENIKLLQGYGVKLIALRSAGFNHVDLAAAKKFGIKVVRVPEYSPYSVAEHAVCLLLALNRKVHRAYQRVRELNFSLEGLTGFDLHGKIVGVIGVGRIGKIFSKIMKGFGCEVLAFDINQDASFSKEVGIQYASLEKIFSSADIISLHVPLNPQTRHIINRESLEKMKKGVTLINTGRGGLIETSHLIEALKSKKIGAAGLDVYEEEENIFFKDLSVEGIQDETLARLLTFPNVLITSHQGFLTEEALNNIAKTTLQNISDFEAGLPLKNQVSI